MKKVMMTTVCLMIVLSIIGVAVAATSPYVIEGGVFLDEDESYKGRVDLHKVETAVYPEAVKGYWWRDPSNQNKLAEHSAIEFDNQVQTVYSSRLLRIFVWKSQYEGNVILAYTKSPIYDDGNFISEEYGFLLIGTGGSREAAAAAKAAFSNAVPEFSVDKIYGIVYLDSDVTSVAGVSEFVTTSSSLQFYAEESLVPEIQKELSVKDARLLRTSKMQGWNLVDSSTSAMQWGSDGYLGLGSGYNPSKTTSAALEVYPAVTTSGTANYTFVKNKVPFTLMPSGIDGVLDIWIPGHKILILGEPFGNYLPDIAPLNRKNISVDSACTLLGKLISLAPNNIVMLHGQSVIGREASMLMLNNQKTALEYVRDQTLLQTNAGVPIDEIAAGMTLPAELSASPYVQEFTTTLASLSKAVYAENFGWFDGDVKSLSGMSDYAEAACLADLAGGPKKLLEKARAALESQNLADIQKALLLSDAARTVSQDYEASQVYIMALKKLAYCQTSAQMRNYYLSEARAVQDEITPPTHEDNHNGHR
ncbi:MAG: hypothetical protein HGA22_05970 [Clostridiales bacterium]|nr:hypothetical protein [Clostridiales bacterium]